MTFKLKKENLFDFNFKSGLYAITCLANQKHYIGESSNVTARLNAHKNKLKRNLHENLALQQDFNFYGEEKFLFQKLFFGAGLQKSQRQDLESCILLTLSPLFRYNVYTNWRKRESLLNPFFNKKHTFEARQAQALSKIGKTSAFAGHKQTNQVKFLISQANSGKADRKKPLFIDSVYYESISEASEKTGLGRRLIRERCHSQEPRFQNYKWACKSSLL